jgi:Holliday junction DNA helicase RuvA
VISYLKGQLKEVGEESFLLVVKDVGYEIFATSTYLNELESSWGKEIEVWIYNHVREDLLQLFGFAQREEKSFFLNLLKINGVGPKSAMHVLGGASLSQLYEMIEHEDVKGLSKLPKVGKKTAEQMILSLKGKLVRAESNNLEKKQNLPRLSNQLQLVASALTHLGYRTQDIALVVQDFPSDIELQDGVRRGLQALAKQI